MQGWLYEMKRETFSVRTKGSCQVHLVPYSEHSSFEELQRYVAFLRPHKVGERAWAGGYGGVRKGSSMVNAFGRWNYNRNPNLSR
jgi:hypothetical protein